MSRSIYGGFLRAMEWKSVANDTAERRKELFRRSQGGHAGTKGLAAGEEWRIKVFPESRAGSRDRGGGKGGGIGPLLFCLHVRKLKTEDGDPLRAEQSRELSQQRMVHSGSSSVGQGEACDWFFGELEEGRDFFGSDIQGQWFWRIHRKNLSKKGLGCKSLGRVPLMHF